MDLSGSRARGTRGSGLGVTRLASPVVAEDGSTTSALVLESEDEGVEALLSALVGEFDVRLVHAPRRADPRRYGRPLEHGHWLVGPCDAPDPDALFAMLRSLEVLLLEEQTRPCLVAWGEGAGLALALATCWGDRLAAVVAIGGGLPALPPEVVQAEIGGLPILRAPGPGGGVPAPERDARWAELAARGARITHWKRTPPADSMASWLREALLARL